MLALRPYQEESVFGLFEYFASHPTGNPIVALPTGTGKSVVIAEFIRRALSLYPFTRIIVATHVRELIRQNFTEMLELWPSAPAGIYSAGLKRRDTHCNVTFAGIASIAKKLDHFGHIDLVLVDECHLISHREMTQYRKAIDALRTVNPHIRVIGLTATPWRLGLGLLTDGGGVFTDISTDYCTLERFNLLVEQGYICPLIPRKTEVELITEGVHIQHGEFITHELQEAVDKETITRAALREAVVQAHDRNHWLVFTTGVKHANNTCDILNELGVPAVAVHTALPGGDKQRDLHIDKFKAGEVRAMVGIGIFTTGFNMKAIDCIVMLRPTMSSVLWVQMCGRGTRHSPETGKKNCLVLDFARNTVRLGPVNDPVVPRKPVKKGSPMVPFKLCPECAAYNHTRSMVCCDCGFQFPASEFKVTQHAAAYELIRKTPAAKPPKAPPPPAAIVEYKVNRVEFARHTSRDVSKPPSVRVSYVCGLHVLNEWLCFEHAHGLPKHKAHESWRQMAKTDPPKTVDEALSRLGELTPPSTIRVLHNDKYPQVVGYGFEGEKPVVDTEIIPF